LWGGRAAGKRKQRTNKARGAYLLEGTPPINAMAGQSQRSPESRPVRGKEPGTLNARTHYISFSNLLGKDVRRIPETTGTPLRWAKTTRVTNVESVQLFAPPDEIPPPVVLSPFHR